MRRYGLRKYQRGSLYGVAGTMMGAGATNTDVLTLNTLSATHVNENSVATAAIRVNSNGDVEERVNTTYTAQNSGTEWIDGFATSSASDYECKLTGSESGSGTLTGTLNIWYDCNTSPEWKCVSNNSQVFGVSGGSLYIREKLDTANEVSASASITADGVGL